jgi:amino acid transporter
MNAPFVNDAEKGTQVETNSDRPSDDGLHYGSYEEAPSFLTRLGVTPSSFKRRTLADKHNQLNQSMKTRHLHMISIGGSIGAGLFVGSGGALSRGGPAALLIGFGIIGVVSIRILLWGVLTTNGRAR